MNIKINGRKKSFRNEEMMVQDVLDAFPSNTMFYVVFRNGEFVDRLQYLKLQVEEGDEFVIYPLVSGA